MGRVLWIVGVLVSSCVPFFGVSGDVRGPVGGVSNGLLIEGVPVGRVRDDVASYKVNNRYFGAASMGELVDHVGAHVAAASGGGPVLLGDVSAPRGGRISGHRSHRTGLDVDIAYFVRQRAGHERDPFPLHTCDRFAVCKEGTRYAYFDTEKNWQVVKALLTHPRVAVQWIFVSHGVKARLLYHALSRNEPIDLVVRAARILHQPTDSAAHDDHFHVRIHCPVRVDGFSACGQFPPVRHQVRSRTAQHKGLSDDELVRLATERL